ncbi:response regulator [Desulfococcaceae bacterium HSG8]|nr:response regulator [Desulfococcaceae bacterium HSG8]
MKRVLVIDDDPVIRRLLRSALEKAGYEVTEAPDGRIGTKCHREEPADLIILDLIMPEKEGIETLIELKQDFPDVRIITISGGIMGKTETLLTAAKGLGASRTFEKPLDIGKILEAVKDLVMEK